MQQHLHESFSPMASRLAVFLEIPEGPSILLDFEEEIHETWLKKVILESDHKALALHALLCEW